MRRIGTATAAVLALATAPAPAAEDIEQPDYEVIRTVGEVEVREYAPYLVAETTVEAPSRDAASGMGFRALAGYIFGGNGGSDRIAMTAPVTTQATGARIAMTAPVTTEASGEGTYTIRFSMPSKWTMETLPEPNDPDVILREVPAETRLAWRFVGPKAQETIEEGRRAIVEVARQEGLELASAPILAGYDGPSVPPSQRRWEVMGVVTDGGS